MVYILVTISLFTTQLSDTMSDPIAKYLLERVKHAEKEMENMHTECDAKLSILTIQIGEKNERIAELEKALADAKASAKALVEASAKAPVEASTKAPVEASAKAPVEASAKALVEASAKALVEASSKATKKPTNVSWADLADKNANGWQTVPPKFTRAKKVDTKAEVNYHGFTKGTMGPWNHNGTHSFSFIFPSDKSATKGLNVYLKDPDLAFFYDEGTIVFFKHEKGHDRGDGSPTRRCVTTRVDNKDGTHSWKPVIYSEEEFAEMIKNEGK